MGDPMLISVEEYLATSHSPDCDYVDGRVEERNFGEWDHATLQTSIAVFFHARRKEWGINVVVEQRVQVSPTRFRIPDVCVVLGDPGADSEETSVHLHRSPVAGGPDEPGRETH